MRPLWHRQWWCRTATSSATAAPPLAARRRFDCYHPLAPSALLPPHALAHTPMRHASSAPSHQHSLTPRRCDGHAKEMLASRRDPNARNAPGSLRGVLHGGQRTQTAATKTDLVHPIGRAAGQRESNRGRGRRGVRRGDGRGGEEAGRDAAHARVRATRPAAEPTCSVHPHTQPPGEHLAAASRPPQLSGAPHVLGTGLREHGPTRVAPWPSQLSRRRSVKP